MIRKREWSASEPERRKSRQEPFLAIEAWKQSFHHRGWRLHGADTGSGRPWGSSKRTTVTEDLGEGLEKRVQHRGAAWRFGSVPCDESQAIRRGSPEVRTTDTKQGVAGWNSTAGEKQINGPCMSRACGRMQGADSTVEQQGSNWNHGAP